MKNISLLFFLLNISIGLSAQTQSLSFFVHALHNFSYVDNDFDQDASIKKPIHVLPSYALEYDKIMPDKKTGYHIALGVVWEGIRLNRKFGPLSNGEPSNLTIGKTISGIAPSLRGGIFRKHNSFRFATGVHLRFISNSFVSISGPQVSDNEFFQAIAEFDFVVKNSVHSSVYINVDYKLFNIDNNELRLNFIGNIGLHPIYRATSIIENFITSERKQIIHNNYGTYLGLGLKLVRSTDDKFKEIFNFQWGN